MPELIDTDLLLQDIIDTLINNYNQSSQTAAQHAHDLIEDVIEAMQNSIDCEIGTYMEKLYDD